MYHVHITLSNVKKIFRISQVYEHRNNSKSLILYVIIPVLESLMLHPSFVEIGPPVLEKKGFYHIIIGMAAILVM